MPGEYQLVTLRQTINMALLWLINPVVCIHLQQRTKPIELLLIHRLALGPAPSAWLAQPALRKVFGAELDFHPKHALANGVNITRHLRRIKARNLFFWFLSFT